MQWFLAHDDQGNLLEPPRVGDLTTIDGRGNATRFMGWLEEGCKGWKPSRGRKRAAGLVSAASWVEEELRHAKTVVAAAVNNTSGHSSNQQYIRTQQ